MKSLIGAIALALGLSAAALASEPAVGLWQGTIKVQGRDLRLVLRIEERAPGRLACFMNFIERGPEPRRCANLEIEGDVVRYRVLETVSRFEGRLSADGRRLEGMWGGPTGQPLRFERTAQAQAWETDNAGHRQSYVTASDGAVIEVLDFGGEGQPLVMVPGLGASGHVFDDFVQRLKGKSRIVAVSRRGYGLSDSPAFHDEAYSTTRLADDVVAVMDALKLNRPALAAWSMGGAEITSIATRFPERVAGLVYLDAAYAYSFYTPGNLIPQGGNLNIHANALRDKIRAADAPGVAPPEAIRIIDGILARDLDELRRDLLAQRALLSLLPPEAPPLGNVTPQALGAAGAISNNVERFGPVKVPVLAIFALPRPPASAEEAAARPTAEMVAASRKDLIARYKAAHPQAKVVEIQDADHAVFRSHPDRVLAEMEAFLAGLGSE